MAYRFAGKQKTLSFGKYPAVALAKARQQRDGAKQVLASGVDPSAKRKLDAIAARSVNNTFRAVAEELLAKHSNDAGLVGLSG